MFSDAARGTVDRTDKLRLRRNKGRLPLQNEHDLPENEIIRRILSGERDLFRELIRRHRTVVYSAIIRLVGDRASAEDLAQETFVRAFQALGRFRGEAKFSTWAVRIALNLTATYLASPAFRQRQRSMTYQEAVHDRDGGRSVEELREEHAQHEQFRQALAEPPDRLRSVLVMCGIEGKPYEEAAAVLGIPIGTVRSRLNKARLTMRELLGRRDAGSKR